jgi:hypothetical protein
MIPSIIEGDEAELRKRSDWNQIATSTPAYLAFTQARSHRMTGVLQGFRWSAEVKEGHHADQ